MRDENKTIVEKSRSKELHFGDSLMLFHATQFYPGVGATPCLRIEYQIDDGVPDWGLGTDRG